MRILHAIHDFLPRHRAGSELYAFHLCRELAPDNFERNEDEGFSYVYKQPETDAERDACREALGSCPVEAIGDDGASATEEAGAETGTA